MANYLQIKWMPQQQRQEEHGLQEIRFPSLTCLPGFSDSRPQVCLGVFFVLRIFVACPDHVHGLLDWLLRDWSRDQRLRRPDWQQFLRESGAEPVAVPPGPRRPTGTRSAPFGTAMGSAAVRWTLGRDGRDQLDVRATREKGRGV